MTVRHFLRAAVGPLVLAALAPPTLAQQAYPFETLHLVSWPPTLPLGSFRRAVLGRFTGDVATQVLVLREDDAVVPPVAVPVLVFDPLGFTDAFYELPVSAGWTDVATLPGAGAGGRDAMVYTDASGLWSVEYDDLGGLTNLSSVGGASWADARQLVVVDVNEDGKLDIAGLDAAGHEILTALGTGSGFASGPSFDFVAEVTAFAFGDFNRTPATTEVCVLLPNRIRFFDVASQSMIKTWTAAVGGGFVTRMKRDDIYLGDVAAVAADLSGTGAWELFTADVFHIGPSKDLFLGTEPQSPTGWVEPSSLSTVAWEAGHEALVMPPLEFSVVYGLPGELAEGAYFANEAVWELDVFPALPTPDDRAIPAIGPFADDMGPGAVFPLDSVNALYYLPEVTPSTYESGEEEFFADATFTANGTDPGVMRVHARPHDDGQGLDHVQIVVWEQDNPFEENLVQPDALRNRVFPFDTYDELWGFDIDLPETTETWSSHRHFYFVVRLVEINPGPHNDDDTVTILAAGREFRAGATLQACSVAPCPEEPPYSEYLTSLPYVIEEEDVFSGATPAPPVGPPSPIGAYVTLGRIPGFASLPPTAPAPKFDSRSTQ